MYALKDEIIEYFQSLDRSFFMDQFKDMAMVDAAFPIGYGQTISQPSLVLAMTIQLDIEPSSRILEIGTGSGYQTALLAKFASEVYTIERIQPLYERAMERLEELEFTNIRFKLDDGSYGWEEESPFDRIIVTASARQIPEELVEQLAVGGKMIIPVGGDDFQELLLITKDVMGDINIEHLTDVRFVRLVGKYE